jgi:chromate transporter
LLLLPAFRHATTNPLVDIFDSFYRTGSLVFGGGHVVLPLLQAEVVDPGWISQDIFFAGYGAAQAVPGPLFTFAAYIGVTMEQFRYPILGGLLCLFAIYAPSFLLITGILPYWNRVRSITRLRQGLAGLNSAVLGFLIAALYDPIWTNAINSRVDLAFALGIFCLISIRRWPIWIVVLIAVAMGETLAVI